MQLLIIREKQFQGHAIKNKEILDTKINNKNNTKVDWAKGDTS